LLKGVERQQAQFDNQITPAPYGPPTIQSAMAENVE
jgi:hypothetical protein